MFCQICTTCLLTPFTHFLLQICFATEENNILRSSTQHHLLRTMCSFKLKGLYMRQYHKHNIYFFNLRTPDLNLLPSKLDSHLPFLFNNNILVKLHANCPIMSSMVNYFVNTSVCSSVFQSVQIIPLDFSQSSSLRS